MIQFLLTANNLKYILARVQVIHHVMALFWCHLESCKIYPGQESLHFLWQFIFKSTNSKIFIFETILHVLDHKKQLQISPRKKIKKPGKMQWGESKSFQSKRLSNLTATVWQDTKDVRFLSTLNKPGIITKCTRRVGHRWIEVTMPSATSSYGKYYSAVDHYDRLCSKKVYGNLGHGSNKLWKHLMWHFCNLAIGNAWIIFQKVSQHQNPKKFDHLSFRHELAT